VEDVVLVGTERVLVNTGAEILATDAVGRAVLGDLAEVFSAEIDCTLLIVEEDLGRLEGLLDQLRPILERLISHTIIIEIHIPIGIRVVADIRIGHFWCKRDVAHRVVEADVELLLVRARRGPAVLAEILVLDEDLLQLLVGKQCTLRTVKVLEVANIVQIREALSRVAVRVATVEVVEEIRLAPERKVHLHLMPVEADDRQRLLKEVIEPELERNVELLRLHRGKCTVLTSLVVADGLTKLTIGLGRRGLTLEHKPTAHVVKLLVSNEHGDIVDHGVAKAICPRSVVCTSIPISSAGRDDSVKGRVDVHLAQQIT